MFCLDRLVATTKRRKRVGRGGERGGQSGRGHKGQSARTGAQGELKAFFEGGQMPLSRRLPCRGFVNVFKKEFSIVNIDLLEQHFNNGEVVNAETLMEKRLIKGHNRELIKILGKGTLSKQLTVTVDKISASARVSIQKAGGSVTISNEGEG